MTQITQNPFFSLPPEHIDQWLAGFWEGDGSLYVRREGGKSPEIIFRIYQKDAHILKKIQAHYQRGRVHHRKPAVAVFEVSKQTDVAFFLQLLQGKIHTTARLKMHTQTVQAFSRMFYPLECVQDSPCTDLESAWLSGFIDAEGCFYMKPACKKYSVRFEFSVSQKHEKSTLKTIQEFLTVGALRVHTPTQADRLQVTGMKNMVCVWRYFERYPLQSFKAYGYRFWVKSLELCLAKKHLSSSGHQRLVDWSEKIRRGRPRTEKQGIAARKGETHLSR